MKRYAALTLCLSPLFLQAAEEGAADTPPTSPWSHHLKVGLYFNSVTSSNAESSNDPTINGDNDNINYTIDVDGRLKWEQGKHSVQEDLKLKYGRRYDEEEKWQENTDSIEYDAKYLYNIQTVHNYYAHVGFDSIFTGPEPEEKAFDPRKGQVSTGYEFKLENILPEKDKFETRIGMRVQRSWGTYAAEANKETQTGLEWVTRYERIQNKQLDYFAQYEFFSEFEDTSHTTHLITAGLNYKITPVFSIKLDLRAYYETEPDDIEAGVADDTYDTWSMRQETLIGMAFAF